MRSLFFAGLVFGMTAPALAQATPPEPAQTVTGQQAVGQPIEFGTSHAIESAVLDETRTLNIWLPAGIDEAEEPYTVVYLIDGGVEQDYFHIAGLAQLGALSWQYRPLIIVGIETETRARELTPEPADPRYVEFFPDAGGASDFRRYIADEVIPYVERHYRTGERRAVIGESLAGLFIVDTFLTQPDLFDDYIAISPSLWWDDQAAGKQSPEILAATDHTGDRLYLTMGDEGGTMQAGLDKLLAGLASDPTPPEFHYVDRRETETHGTIFHPSALDAFRRFYSYPPYDYGDYPWYLIEGGQPPEDGPGETTEDGADE